MDNKTIIEINGVKLEVDLTTAKRIDTFHVGDSVKVMLPSPYSGETMRVYPGVIIGFEAFKELPTIVIAYIDASSYNADIKYLYYNKESKGEVILADSAYVPFEKASIIDVMDKQITKKQLELEELQAKKKYFLDNFSRYFKFADNENE